LKLDSIGVKFDSGGKIITDKQFKTNVGNIFAIGDVIDGPMLAHKAEEEGKIDYSIRGIAVAENLAGGQGHVNYDSIPSVVYTHPEVAWCGRTEDQLKAENIKYVTGIFPFLANSRARTIGTNNLTC